MQLDDEEQNIIDQYRLKKNIEREQLAAGHAIVSLASEWAEYSKRTGFGLTYSEFCDGFNVDSRLTEKYIPYRKFIFEGVKRMYVVVDDVSTVIGKQIATGTVT
jgi:hypothetical protein